MRDAFEWLNFIYNPFNLLHAWISISSMGRYDSTICELLMTTDFLDLPALHSDAKADIGRYEVGIFQQESSPLSQVLRLVPRLFAGATRVRHRASLIDRILVTLNRAPLLEKVRLRIYRATGKKQNLLTSEMIKFEEHKWQEAINFMRKLEADA